MATPTPQFIHGHETSHDQLPATLGQKVSAASLSVVIASDYAITTTSTDDHNTGVPTATTLRVVTASRPSTTTTLATNDYTGTPVTTAAYVQLIAATTNAMNLVHIFDSSGSCMIVAVGGAGSESNVLYIEPGGSGTPFQVNIPAGSRVSLKALDTNATAGRFLLTGLA